MKTLDEFLDEIEKNQFCSSNSQCSEEKDKLIKIIREMETALRNYVDPSFCDDGYEAFHTFIRIDKILNEGDGE